MVIISTITFIIQTFPEFQLKDEEDDASAAADQANKVLWAIHALVTIDELAIGFFTVEYVVRFLCSPRKWHFFKEPMNLVDFTAIIPFYLTLVLDSMEDMQGGRHAFLTDALNANCKVEYGIDKKQNTHAER